MFNRSEFVDGWLTLKLRLAERRAVSSDEDLWFSLDPIRLLFDLPEKCRHTSLALPERRDLRVDFWPMVTFPLFITKAKRLEMVSPVFLACTISR